MNGLKSNLALISFHNVPYLLFLIKKYRRKLLKYRSLYQLCYYSKETALNFGRVNGNQLNIFTYIQY